MAWCKFILRFLNLLQGFCVSMALWRGANENEHFTGSTSPMKHLQGSCASFRRRCGSVRIFLADDESSAGILSVRHSRR